MVAEAVATYRGVRGPLLPILHAVQAELGHVPPSVVPLLAERLNLSRAEVHGVVTFYRDFRAAPPGRVPGVQGDRGAGDAGDDAGRGRAWRGAGGAGRG